MWGSCECHVGLARSHGPFETDLSYFSLLIRVRFASFHGAQYGHGVSPGSGRLGLSASDTQPTSMIGIPASVVADGGTTSLLRITPALWEIFTNIGHLWGDDLARLHACRSA
jgi:hypothetical protein